MTGETVTSAVSNGNGGTDSYVTTTTNDYKAETAAGNGDWSGAYQGGVVTHSHAVTTKNGALQSTADTTNGYQWWDGAEQATIRIVTDNVSTPDSDFTTTYGYDAIGHLNSIYVGDGRPRTISFVDAPDGTILQRDEADGITSGDPREVYSYFDGVRVGDVSNNGTSDVDYAQGIAAHNAAQGTGPFRGGASGGTSYAEFDESYDPINGLNQAGSNSRYTVQSGDTLQSIAQALWGDASLWYKLADVNGLDGSETLVEGRDLIVPANVSSSHNTSDAYRVYNPNDAIGDVSPTTPKPQPKPHHSDCGVFGAILLVVIAVAIVAIAGPAIIGAPSAIGSTTASLGTLGTVSLPTVSAATGLTAVLGGVGAAAGSAAAIGAGVLGGAVAGALGSVVSQGVGLALGIQDKFSWKGVALAGLSGGVGGGLGGVGFLNGASGIAGVAQDAARGALGNLATQGIAVATGLQDGFDWAGVASGAAAGAAVGGVHPGGFGGRLVSGAAGAIAGGAARSLANGTDFGDNILAALPDVIGSTIGELVAGEIAGGGGRGIGVFGNRASDPLGAGASHLQDQDSDVVVTATNEAIAKARGLWGWLKSAFHGVEDGIEHIFTGAARDAAEQDAIVSRIASPRVNGLTSTAYVDALARAPRQYAAASGPGGWQRAGSTIVSGLDTVAQYTVGPGTPLDTLVGQPFRAVVGAIADSPAGDAGNIATLESSGILTPVGAVLAGIRAINTLELGEGVAVESRTFLTPAEFAELPATGSINPNVIRFSQDSAGASFQPPFGSVDDFAEGLANRSIDPASIDPIRIVEKDGLIHTLDNRRLYAFQQAYDRAGLEIPYQKLDSVPEDQLFKFSTVNSGESIVIRRR